MYNTLFNPQVQGYLGSLQDKTEVFVGVHVRRTDYLDWIIDKYEVSTLFSVHCSVQCT